jgi:hypothetical protein
VDFGVFGALTATSEGNTVTRAAGFGHQPPVAVTSKFLVPGGIEWLVFGNQVDRENFRTRPTAVFRLFPKKQSLHFALNSNL